MRRLLAASLTLAILVAPVRARATEPLRLGLSYAQLGTTAHGQASILLASRGPAASDEALDPEAQKFEPELAKKQRTLAIALGIVVGAALCFGTIKYFYDNTEPVAAIRF